VRQHGSLEREVGSLVVRVVLGTGERAFERVAAAQVVRGLRGGPSMIAAYISRTSSRMR
jgi:hypothetical protein